MTKILIFFFVLSSVYNVVFSQGTITSTQVDIQTIESKIEGTALSLPAPQMNILLADNLSSSLLRKKVLDAHAQVSFTIDDLFLLGGLVLDGFSISFTVTLKNSGVIVSSINKSLAINSNNPKSLIHINLTNELSNLLIDEIVVHNIILISPVINIGFSTQAVEINNYIEQKQILKLDYTCNYGIDVRENSIGFPLATSPQIIPFTYSSSPNILTSRVQKFEWTTSLEFPNHEIQILKLNNIDNSKLNENDIQAIVGWDNALKIETTNDVKSVLLTVAEGTGFYLWRVRPIGNFFDGGYADARNWGEWSDINAWDAIHSNDDLINLNVNDISLFPFAFFLQDPDDEKNWMYNRIIVEGNKTAEGMVYANNLLQTVQSQTYSSTTKKSIISQTVMDYLGRPSLSTLPVPVSRTDNNGNEGLLGYEDQFFLNSTGNLYSAENFDSDDPNGDLIAPESAEQTTSNFNYYSSNNSDNSVADAEGIPFTRTIFLPDGSGRVMESSGVGSVHAIGGGHTSKILYATPSDDELIAIFGDEAPQASNILKTITIDPNGTASIAYTTIEGVTIATAMSSTSPSNLLDIDNPGNTGEYFPLLSIKSKAIVNTLSDQKIITSKVLAIEQPTDISIDYRFLSGNTFGGGGCSSGNCNYSVRFIVSDISTGKRIVSDLISLDGIPVGDIISSSYFHWSSLDIISGVNYSSWTNSITLPPGNWKVQKVVSSGLNVETLSSSSESQQYLGPLIDLVAEWMSNATSELELENFNLMLSDLISNINLAHSNAVGNFEDPIYQQSFNTPYFQSLVSNYGFPANYIFNPDYSLEFGLSDPLNPSSATDPNQLVFTASCCNNLGVVLPEKKVYPVCKTIEDNIAANSLIIDDVAFSDLFRVLYNEIINPPLTIPGVSDDSYVSAWSDALQGYSILLNGDNYPDPSINSQVLTSIVDEMVYHMLTDRYFSGKAELTGGNWQWESSPGVMSPVYDMTSGVDVPTISIDDKENYGPYYVCDELYECWYASIRAYFELIKQRDAGPVDIYASVDNDDPETSGESDDQLQGGNGDGSSILDKIMAIFNNFISKKTKKFSEDLTTGNNGVEKMVIQYNVPSTFLECTGYKFAAIIDLPDIDLTPTFNGLGEVNDPIFEQDRTTYFPDNMVFAVEPDITGTLVQVVPAQMMYKNIMSPIWAFKYFEYNPELTVPTSTSYVCDPLSGLPSGSGNSFVNTNPNTPPQLSSISALEISNCYHDFTNSAVNFCNTDYCTDGGHHNWDSDERYSFFKLVENASPYIPNTSSPCDSLSNSLDINDIDSDGNTTEPLPMVPYTCDELNIMIDNYFADALANCIVRKEYFRSRIVEMLLNNCYEIVPCVDALSPAGYVSELTVDKMADDAIVACEDYLNQLRIDCGLISPLSCGAAFNTGASAPFYPFSKVESCSVISGTTICCTSEKVTVLFDPTLHIEEKVGRLVSGHFLPYGIASMCPSGISNGIPPIIESCNDLNESYSPEINVN